MRFSHLKPNLLLYSMLLVLLNCSDAETIPPAGQEILFGVSYVNYAWGKQNRGFFINQKGQVYTYNNPAKWNFPQEDASLSEVLMKENLSASQLKDTIISATEVKKFASVLYDIREDRFSPRTAKGADMGSTTYYAFRFDPDSKTYKPVLLALYGDFETQNLDLNAVEITNWLKTLTASLYK